MIVISKLWTLNYVDCVPFSYMILSILLTIELTYFEKSFSWICKKHDQTSINLIDVFDFIDSFLNYLAFNEIKWLCAFNKYTTQKLLTKPQCVNELILTPFSPFDIKCKKLNMNKTSGNAFLGHLGGWVFHIFPRLHSIISRGGGDPDTFPEQQVKFVQS